MNASIIRGQKFISAKKTLKSTIHLSQELQMEILVQESFPLSPTNSINQQLQRLSSTTNHTSQIKGSQTLTTMPFYIQGDHAHGSCLAPINDISSSPEDQEDVLRYQIIPGDQGIDRPETEQEEIQPKELNSMKVTKGTRGKQKKNLNRKDMFSIPIQSQSKSHHVTFRDQMTQQKIKDVHIVQNWKIYQKQEETDDDDCCCTIF